MFNISDELKFSLNLPYPPIYDLRQTPHLSFQIPHFYGYEAPSTRWILATLTNKTSLKRLMKLGKTHEDIFSRYYQVPDRPIELMGPDYTLEQSAYHPQYVLYLTPLCMAVYLKQTHAVELLLNLKNENGKRLVHPSEPCFVQKVFRKGEKRMSNELSNSFPIILAIRRSFYEGVTLLTEFGYNPQKQFSILTRQPYRESVVLYRDIVDYLTELLRVRPGLNVTKLLRILSDRYLGLTTFDFFVFDLELTNSKKWDYVSIFRRVCRSGLLTKFFLEESATQLINILENIQMVGYFNGTRQMKIYYHGSPADENEINFSESVIKELEGRRISQIMEKIPTIIKAFRHDLLKMDEKELETRLQFDYQTSLGMLFSWYQKCLFQERMSQYIKLTMLISRIIVDTNVISHFFDKSNKELAETFTTWANDLIKEATVNDFRIRMQDFMLFNDTMCINFINKFGEIPHKLIKAPLLHNKHPEDSPVVRELIFISTSTLNATNENINQSNVTVFNMVDNEENVMYKLIPANHIRSYNFDNVNNLNNINIRNYPSNSSLNKDELNNDDFNTRKTSSDDMVKTEIKIANSFEYNDKIFNDNNFNSLNFNMQMLPPKPVGRNKPNSSSNNKNNYKSKICRTKSQEISMKQKEDFYTASNNYDEEESEKLRYKLRNLLSTDKFKDIKLNCDNEEQIKVPLKYLLKEIEKYDSSEFILHNLQSKISTKLDSLYNNLGAASFSYIMKDLAQQTNFTKSDNVNNNLYPVFQNN